MTATRDRPRPRIRRPAAAPPPPGERTSARPGLGRAAARVAALAVLLALVLGEIGALAYVDRLANFGVTWGLDQQPIAGTQGSPLGVNVFLEKESDPANVRRTLDLVQAGGFQWIRQGFPWNDIEISGKGDFVDTRNGAPKSAWAKYDYIVDQATQRHIQILARLDAPPAWAQPPPNYQNACGGTAVDFSHSPPANLSDFADFVTAVVSRYKGRIRYFQIWNEPNLIGEWPPQPDAAAYTALLKVAYQAAHTANPDAVVVMAPLAQTTAGGCNPNDLTFLQDMYTAGAQPYFDLASVMAYGLANSPLDRRADFNRINFSRPELARDIMVHNGDAAKGVWASEYGWVSLPPDWGANPLNKPGIWGNISAAQQAQYLVEGYQRARADWPWMGPMFVWHMRDPAPIPHEPQPYFGILNTDFSPRPAYLALQAYSRRFPIADIGAVTVDNPAFSTSGAWHAAGTAAQPARQALDPTSTGTLTFDGNAVAIVVGPGGGGTLTVTVDGAAPPGDAAALIVPAAGTAAFQTAAVPGWGGPAAQIAVAASLSAGRHVLAFHLAPGAPPVTVLGFVVGREPPNAWVYPAGYLLLTALALWLGVRTTFAALAVPPALRRAFAGRALDARLAPTAVWLGLIVTLAAYALIPSQRAALGLLGLWFLLAILRPDQAIVITAATLPFYAAPRAIGSWTFPLSETCLWLTLAAWALHRGWVAWRVRGAPALAAPVAVALPGVAWRERLRAALTRDLFAGPAVALLAVGTFSLLTVANPAYIKDSLHAYRWVIVEPVLFYFLVTDLLRGTRQALRLADAYVAGCVLAAAIALGMALLHVPGSTLDVQGVTRLQGLFSHPDNLGIFLGRGLAFVVALAVLLRAAGERPRRIAYALAGLVIAVAVFFSFSRGAWLAVLVAAGWTVWLVGGRAARVFAGALVAAGTAVFAAAEAHLLPERILHTGSGVIRVDLWQTSLHMLRDHPIFGIGLDQFLNQYQGPYADPAHQAERWTSHPHNLVLDWWLSLGIMGVLVAGWLAVRVARGGWALVRTADIRGRALAGAALAGLLAMLVHGLIDNSYFLQDLALTFWLFCAFLQLLWKQGPVPLPHAPAGDGARQPGRG